MTTRRETLSVLLAGGVLAGVPGAPAAADRTAAASHTRRWRSGLDGQRRADLGDGRFLNPVLAGDHPDPAILKDGENYYATFTSFEYYPGLLIWHSRDLVNWTPMSPAVTKPIGSIYAVDIVRHGGRYVIYMPVLARPEMALAPGYDTDRQRLTIFAIHAESMAGPWSDPIDMGIYGYIDPSHVVGEDGKRYLYLSEGRVFPLTGDGLHAAGPGRKVYDGWPYPNDWIDEGFSLEGPWVIRKGAWFYMFSAQGGTAGPPTSHMIVVARSRSVHGPWENGPNNPIVHTRSRNEPWWSRGHPAVIEGPDGDWWIAYHGYENGFRTLGRQLLLEPLDWTAEGWPYATGGDLSRPLPMPARLRDAAHGLALSGPFTPGDLGRRCAFYRPKPDYADRVRFEGGALRLRAEGGQQIDSSPLAFITGDTRYTMSVEVELEGDVFGGILLFYNEKLFCGLDRDADRQRHFRRGKTPTHMPLGQRLGRRFHLKVVNDEDVASFYSSVDGKAWTREVSFEVSGYNHNVGDGFISLRPALVSSGQGQAIFRNLRYVAGA